MRVLVCGGRDFNDMGAVFRQLDALCPPPVGSEPNKTWLPPNDMVVISGGAKGADSFAIEWAIANWVKFIEYFADWDKHGKAAGPIRNQRMLDEGKPDLVLAFPGGRGTADMVRRARKAGVRVIEVE